MSSKDAALHMVSLMIFRRSKAAVLLPLGLSTVDKYPQLE
jgi:hypothetical protein